MSTFCLCVIDDIRKEEKIHVFHQIEILAQKYTYGISECVEWEEPLLINLGQDSFVININDDCACDNCEMLLLPDGWYYNGKTNNKPFKQRVEFLLDISKILLNRNFSFSFYIGESGESINEFIDFEVAHLDLIQFLSETIGKKGIYTGFHICICQ